MKSVLIVLVVIETAILLWGIITNLKKKKQLHAIIDYEENISKKNYCFIPDLGKYEGTYTDEKLCEMWNITPDEFEYIKSKIGEIGGDE